MKSLCVLTMAVVVALGAVSARATLELYEDFEAYAVDTSINHLGDDAGYERWAAQRNSSAIGDSNHSTVVSVNGDQMLQLTDRDSDDAIDTVYTSMAFGSKVITGQGTVYLQYKADGPNDHIMTLNDLPSGYFGADANTDSQGTNNYSAMSPMVRMSADQPFHAYNVGGYEDVDAGQVSGVWQEIWMQVDVPNQRVKYYVCDEGGTPTAMLNGSSEWWGFRSSLSMAFNLKFFAGGYPWPDMNIETNVLVDNIAIDASEFSLNGVWDGTIAGHDDGPPPCIPGDANCDGVVNIDDFVALKNGFGTGSTWAEGDFDGNGEVNIDDFVILKNHFGDTAVPEPATMSLLALGGLGLIRRRR